MRTLVSNVFQSADDSANTSGNDHAQLFHTGANTAGYTLTSVTVNSDDTQDDDFDVEVCEEDGGPDEFPSNNAADCTALTAPASFVGVGNVVFTHTGLSLSANTNYVVVIKQRGTGSVELDSTTSSGEDASGLSDWSIKNKFYWKSGSTWMLKSGSNEALSIIVFGYEGGFNDATLSALSVSGATLSPAFAAATTDYQATVANSVTQVTITETTSATMATVEYLDDSDATLTDADTMTAGLQMNLSVGTNIVKVKVTAPDTMTTATYTVNVFRVAVPVACSAASMQNRIWTGNLTAGLGAISGFSEGKYGHLDSKMITYNGTNYTVKSVLRSGTGFTLGLYFTLTSSNFGADAADLVLHVDSRQYPFNDATLDSNGRTYKWTSNIPSGQLSDGDAVCLALTVDGPDVSSVALTSAPGSDNTYAIGDSVAATVTFDAAVDITGTPQLELDFDGNAKAAACATGTNTNTMACEYEVVAGDSAPNGVAIAANKLTGGTITATGSTTNNADLDHTAVAIDATHKVDGIRPTLVTTGTDAPRTSTDGMQVILTFSEDIGAVSLSDIDVTANSTSGYEQGATVSRSGRTVTLTLLFPSLTIQAGWAVTVELSADAVDDAAGNGILALAATTVTNANAFATTAPTVIILALASDPGPDNTYAIGDDIEATVTFDAAVDITGTPQLELDFDGTAKAAACATGANTNTFTMACEYEVVAGDSAPNGIAIAANKLTGGTITATGSSTTADLDHTAVAIAATHKVDGIRPTLVTTGTDAPTTSTDGTKVILTFSEDIGAVSHSDITIQANSVNLSTTMASVAGTRVELTLMTALTDTTATLTVELGIDAVLDTARNGNLAAAATPVTNAVGTTGSNTAPTPPPPVNYPPLAVDDAADTPEDTPVTISVLGNDSDPDGNTLTVVEVSAPTHGTAAVADTGAVVYTPEPDFHGTDRFTYVVGDGSGLTARATVDVTVLPVNDPPLAGDDAEETPEDTPVTIDVLGNDSDVDGDALTVVEVSAPTHGTAVVDTGAVVYTPEPDFHGTDSFTYVVGDGSGLTARAAVDVTVRPVNDPPLATGVIPDRTLDIGDEPAVLDLIPFFADRDGDALGYTAVVSDQAVALHLTGATLTLTATRPGTATVTVTAQDLGGLTATQAFMVTTTDHQEARSVKAWLARFGRTVANHAVEAVRGRMSSTQGPSRRVTLGGAELRQPPAPEITQASPWDELVPEDRRPENFNSLRMREFLLSSSFEVPLAQNATQDPGPGWTAWGGAARTSFSGRDSEVSIDGDVTTATLGVDRAWDRVLLGLALARSTGDGSYGAGDIKGDLKSSITSAHPYLRFSLNDRLSAWTLLGYGRGELTLTHGGGEKKTDLEMKMAALGARGALVAAGGFDLAARTDALLVRTSSEGTSEMAETEADVSRLRLVLEGSRPFASASGTSLTPSVEVGVRRDGGDAERGVGFEVGGAMRYANPSIGLTVEITARRLMAHEQSGYSEWGAGGSLQFAPGGAERGFSAKLGSSVGTAASGVEGLWAMGDTRGLTGGAQAPGRVDAEAGYAMGAFGGSGVITPYGGFSMSGDRRYRAGWRLRLGDSFNLSLEGDRTENPDAPSRHAVALRGDLRW